MERASWAARLRIPATGASFPEAAGGKTPLPRHLTRRASMCHPIERLQLPKECAELLGILRGVGSAKATAEIPCCSIVDRAVGDAFAEDVAKSLEFGAVFGGELPFPRLKKDLPHRLQGCESAVQHGVQNLQPDNRPRKQAA